MIMQKLTLLLAAVAALIATRRSDTEQLGEKQREIEDLRGQLKEAKLQAGGLDAREEGELDAQLDQLLELATNAEVPETSGVLPTGSASSDTGGPDGKLPGTNDLKGPQTDDRVDADVAAERERDRQFSQQS